MHIPPFDNKNIPIVDINNSKVPLNYFNIVKLQRNESYEYQVPGYETCIVPSTGTIDIEVQEFNFSILVILSSFIFASIWLSILVFLKSEL